MNPLARVACVAATLTAMAAGAEWHLKNQPTTASVAASVTTASQLVTPCPPRTLMDDEACVPVADLTQDTGTALDVQERLPRYPGRPSSITSYELPITRGSESQVRTELWPTPSGPHIALTYLPAPPGSLVQVRAFEGQDQPARVVFVGQLFGTTVVTQHQVTIGQRLIPHFAIYAGLANVSTEVGQTAADGTELGSIANGDGERAVGLRYAIRRARSEVPGNRFVDDIGSACLAPLLTLDVDIRNLLQKK